MEITPTWRKVGNLTWHDSLTGMPTSQAVSGVQRSNLGLANSLQSRIHVSIKSCFPHGSRLIISYWKRQCGFTALEIEGRQPCKAAQQIGHAYIPGAFESYAFILNFLNTSMQLAMETHGTSFSSRVRLQSNCKEAIGISTNYIKVVAKNEFLSKHSYRRAIVSNNLDRSKSKRT